MYSNLGQLQQALTYLQQSLPIVREVVDRAKEAATLSNIGFVYSNKFQALQIDEWLNLLRMQYNYRLAERLNWHESTRCPIKSCSLVSCSIAEIVEQLDYYRQKKRLTQHEERVLLRIALIVALTSLKLLRIDGIVVMSVVWSWIGM